MAEPLLPLGPFSPPQVLPVLLLRVQPGPRVHREAAPAMVRGWGLAQAPPGPSQRLPSASLREQFCLQPPGPSLAPALQPGSRALRLTPSPPNRDSVNICCLAVFAVPGLPVIFILWMLYLMRLQPVVCGCLWDVSFWGDRMRLSLCVCPCELSRCVFLSDRV